MKKEDFSSCSEDDKTNCKGQEKKKVPSQVNTASDSDDNASAESKMAVGAVLVKSGAKTSKSANIMLNNDDDDDIDDDEPLQPLEIVKEF